LILAIETATKVCSVAFKKEGRLDERRTEEYGHHSERLFVFIKELQADWGFKIKDLSAVLVSEGPGSYTGLRIGASGVKGLLFGQPVPLIAINTLAAMAWGIREGESYPRIIHATIDARRKHLYHQAFEAAKKEFRPLSLADIRTLEELNEDIGQNDFIVGTGWDRLDSDLLDSSTQYGIDKISAVNLISIYESEMMPHTFDPEETNEVIHLLREVDPAGFDPRYITRKKAGT